ncbi:MAG: Trk system potassium transporter TrkA [Pseudomonadota bacterium]
MKIIVCGAGNVGFSIASYLEKYDNDIVVIDQSEELVRRISDRHDIQGICGYASDPSILTRAGAAEADLIIAVTHHDEVNMVACEVAHALFNVPTKIARIRNQAYLDPQWVHLFDDFNLSIDVTISPEIEVARSIGQSLSVPGVFRVSPLVDGLVNIIGVKCTLDTPIINTPITHITSIFPEAEMRVVAINRPTHSFLPNDKETLLPGDEVLFAVSHDKVVEALKAFGQYETDKRRVIIVGAGNVGLSLAQNLEDLLPDLDVRIIEKLKNRAREISKYLTDTLVLHGDALDSEVLEEAGVENTDTIVAVTEDDKVNTLTSLLAKRSGAKRAVALVNNTASHPLVTSLGVDAIISPKEITVSSILEHVRRGHIRSIHILKQGFAEIFEGEIQENSSLTGASLLDIEIPGKVLLAAIVRDRTVLMPSANITLQLNDRIVLVVASESIIETEKLFSTRLEYFR